MGSISRDTTILECFLRDSEGAFAGGDLDELKTALRIVCEFRAFLDMVPVDKYPSTRDVATTRMVETLRSGMDSFFCLFAMNKIIKNCNKSVLSPSALTTFGRFHDKYCSVFERMCRVPLAIQDRLACLLELNKLHFVFIGLAIE